MGNAGTTFMSITTVVLLLLVFALFNEGFDNGPASGSHAIAGAIIVAGALIAIAIYYRPKP